MILNFDETRSEKNSQNSYLTKAQVSKTFLGIFHFMQSYSNIFYLLKTSWEKKIVKSINSMCAEFNMALAKKVAKLYVSLK